MINIRPLASSSGGNCYYITDSIAPLLLECGMPIKRIRQGVGFTVSELAGCLITHEHNDHSKAVRDLMKAGVDCYMSQGTAEALNVEGHRLKIVKAHEQFTIGSWTVLPFDTQHDAAEPLGFLLANTAGDKLFYATDTYYIKYRFQGLSHIMVEANYALDILKKNVESGLVDEVTKNRILRSHFSLDNLKTMLKVNDLSRVREIWLLHLSADNSDAKRFEKEVKEATGKPVYVARA